MQKWLIKMNGKKPKNLSSKEELKKRRGK